MNKNVHQNANQNAKTCYTEVLKLAKRKHQERMNIKGTKELLIELAKMQKHKNAQYIEFVDTDGRIIPFSRLTIVDAENLAEEDNVIMNTIIFRQH